MTTFSSPPCCFDPMDNSIIDNASVPLWWPAQPPVPVKSICQYGSMSCTYGYAAPSPQPTNAMFPPLHTSTMPVEEPCFFSPYPTMPPVSSHRSPPVGLECCRLATHTTASSGPQDYNYVPVNYPCTDVLDHLFQENNHPFTMPAEPDTANPETNKFYSYQANTPDLLSYVSPSSADSVATDYDSNSPILWNTSSSTSSASSSSYSSPFPFPVPPTSPHTDPSLFQHLYTPMSDTVPEKKSRSTREKRHVCPICFHRSRRRHNLLEHMQTHDPNRPRKYICRHCERPFARKYDMKRHEKIHSR
ncbi:uncharacterized protein BYT42DRAFT_554633 [Radiomyces spectabilis]|uniref:uncharacterized protein n=1 Tax=Radiomyces spectabilis TaxID=64574 RepID=UPI0022205081|nr:uncharacterized protein BYT42DRAFT_554633 [Radiomyces spectabilis]KAI8390868.1 hypothetical protein BYT42DRAFT_554633 [Radiomyces spectabilis]